ncbi:MAG: PH domain-containing protein, partial [Christensenellaceae bacterium]|nr:PH domain-containing protein [Christensenellaceae bacterium]
MPDATTPLWKDRKRILGLPISFTRYSIEDGRLLVRKGFFRTEINELLLYRVMDLKLVRSLGQRMLGVGTVSLFSADKTDGTLALQNVKNSDKLRALLSKLIEEE